MRPEHSGPVADVLPGVSLLLLMSCQAPGEAGHERTGIVMTLLMVLHQILNRKWHAALFKGRPSAHRSAPAESE